MLYETQIMKLVDGETVPGFIASFKDTLPEVPNNMP